MTTLDSKAFFTDCDLPDTSYYTILDDPYQPSHSDMYTKMFGTYVWILSLI